MKIPLLRLVLLATLTAVASVGQAAPAFVNGLALPGDLRDVKEPGKPTDSKLRVGYFSDIYYDPNRHEWWGTLRPRPRRRGAAL